MEQWNLTQNDAILAQVHIYEHDMYNCFLNKKQKSKNIDTNFLNFNLKTTVRNVRMEIMNMQSYLQEKKGKNDINKWDEIVNNNIAEMNED